MNMPCALCKGTHPTLLVLRRSDNLKEAEPWWDDVSWSTDQETKWTEEPPNLMRRCDSSSSETSAEFSELQEVQEDDASVETFQR